MAQKKKPKKATTRWEGMTPLEVHASQIHELYKAFRNAGFPVDVAITLCTDKSAQPGWFQSSDISDLLEEDED